MIKKTKRMKWCSRCGDWKAIYGGYAAKLCNECRYYNKVHYKKKVKPLERFKSTHYMFNESPPHLSRYLKKHNSQFMKFRRRLIKHNIKVGEVKSNE